MGLRGKPTHYWDNHRAEANLLLRKWLRRVRDDFTTPDNSFDMKATKKELELLVKQIEAAAQREYDAEAAANKNKKDAETPKKGSELRAKSLQENFAHRNPFTDELLDILSRAYDPAYKNFEEFLHGLPIRWENRLPGALSEAQFSRSEWVEKLLDSFSKRHEKWITLVVADGGYGKTNLAFQASKEIAEVRKSHHIFSWSFYQQASEEHPLESAQECIEALFAFLKVPQSKLPDHNLDSVRRAQLLLDELSRLPYVVILDGCEVLQCREAQGHLQKGDFKDKVLRDLFVLISRDKSKGLGASHLLLTSRLACPQLRRLNRNSEAEAKAVFFEEIQLPPFSEKESVDFLTLSGLQSGADKREVQVLREIHADLHGHPLTLTVCAALVRRLYPLADNKGNADRYPIIRAELKHTLAVLEQHLPSSDANSESLLRRLTALTAYYDRQLTAYQKYLLRSLALFNGPVTLAELKYALAQIPTEKKKADLTLLTSVSQEDWVLEVVKSLPELILCLNGDTFALHPLIKEFYLRRFQEEDANLVRELHEKLAEYYLSLFLRECSLELEYLYEYNGRKGTKIENPEDLEQVINQQFGFYNQVSNCLIRHQANWVQLEIAFQVVYHFCHTNQVRKALLFYTLVIQQGDVEYLGNCLGQINKSYELLVLISRREKELGGLLEGSPERYLLLSSYSKTTRCLGRLEEMSQYTVGVETLEAGLQYIRQDDPYKKHLIISTLILVTQFSDFYALGIAPDKVKQSLNDWVEFLDSRIDDSFVKPERAFLFLHYIKIVADCGWVDYMQSNFLAEEVLVDIENYANDFYQTFDLKEQDDIEEEDSFYYLVALSLRTDSRRLFRYLWLYFKAGRPIDLADEDIFYDLLHNSIRFQAYYPFLKVMVLDRDSGCPLETMLRAFDEVLDLAVRSQDIETKGEMLSLMLYYLLERWESGETADVLRAYLNYAMEEFAEVVQVTRLPFFIVDYRLIFLRYFFLTSENCTANPLYMEYLADTRQYIETISYGKALADLNILTSELQANSDDNISYIITSPEVPVPYTYTYNADTHTWE